MFGRKYGQIVPMNFVDGRCAMGFSPLGCWKGTFVDSGQLERYERIEMEWRLEDEDERCNNKQTNKPTKWGRNTAATNAGMDMGVVT